MNQKVTAIIILCIVILIVLFAGAKSYEGMDVDRGLDPGANDPDNTIIELYEDYSKEKLAFRYVGRGYLKDQLRINLKSVHVYLPKLNNVYDEVRRVEIWGMNQGDNLASEAANFYNSYLEPEIQFRGNPAKYQQILQILPGDHVKLDIIEPVKKIFLIAVM